jgi:DEAD/DEAH box helicase domain-containing protein
MIALIETQDALDQYVMRHFGMFFEKSHGVAVTDPDNRNVMEKHIPYAASEVYVKADDSIYNTTELMQVIDELVAEEVLAPGRDKDIWFCKKRMPQREVVIKAIGAPFHIFHDSGKAIGKLRGSRVFREAFPDSIYLHRGRQYQITELDMQGKRVFCRNADIQYYTQALSKEDTEVNSEECPCKGGCPSCILDPSAVRATNPLIKRVQNSCSEDGFFTIVIIKYRRKNDRSTGNNRCHLTM